MAREHVLQPVAAADGEPARAPPGHQISLRQSGQRNDRRIGIERADGRDRAVERDVLINLVGDHRHVVLVGDLQQLAANRLCVRRAGRVVRVVHDERLGARRDEAADLFRIGLPSVLRIGPVVHLARADLVQDRGVERIGRQRHEHFVAGIGQRREHEVDRLRTSPMS